MDYQTQLPTNSLALDLHLTVQGSSKFAYIPWLVDEPVEKTQLQFLPISPQQIREDQKYFYVHLYFYFSRTLSLLSNDTLFV